MRNLSIDEQKMATSFQQRQATALVKEEAPYALGDGPDRDEMGPPNGATRVGEVGGRGGFVFGRPRDRLAVLTAFAEGGRLPFLVGVFMCSNSRFKENICTSIRREFTSWYCCMVYALSRTRAPEGALLLKSK